MRLSPATVGAAIYLAATLGSHATETFCAVTRETRDGYVALREGPSPSFRTRAKLLPQDFLYVGTESCREDRRGRLLCGENRWLFVEQVLSGGRPKEGVEGWASSRFIRQVSCPAE